MVLDPDGVFALLREQVDRLVETGFVRAAAAADVVWTRTVDEAFAALAAGLLAGPQPARTDPALSAELLEAQP